METLLARLRLPLTILGLLVMFVADRYLGTEKYHLALRIISMVLVGLGLIFTALLVSMTKSTRPAESKSWAHLCLYQIGLLAGLGCYLGYTKVLGDSAAPETPAGKVLLAAWLILLIVSISAGIGGEWSMRSSGRGEFAEPNRVVRGSLSWFSVGILLAFLVTLNFISDKKDMQRDWSYLKVSSPSEATQHMVKALPEDLKIALFYPQSNEVKNVVEGYFKAIAALNPHVKLIWYDKDINPVEAEEYRAARNGLVILDLKGKKGRIDTGTTLAKAKKTLRELDSEFQKAFLETTTQRRTVYFTRGHGELSWIGEASDNPLHSLRMLEGFLRQQNYSTRLFGIPEGSGTAIPDDAAAIVVVGPTEPFQKEEVDALRTYMKNGGNLMVFLDIEKPVADVTAPGGGHQPLYDFLKEVGLDYQEVPLANDKNHFVVTHSDADAWVIFSNIFTSHESVTSLARHDERVAILMYQSGYFNVSTGNGEWKVSETVRSMSDTYADLNKNFKFDKEEKRQAYILGAVAELKNKPPPKVDPKAPKDPKADKAKDVRQGRIVAFADATAVSDALVRNIGNALYFSDSLKWLVGQTDMQGQLASEEDVKIRLSRKEDIYWFQGTVVVVPLLVLGIGFVATRRRRGDQGQQKKVSADAG